MNRRQFLRSTALASASATVTLLLTEIGCSSDSAGGTSAANCSGVGSTSSVNEGHTHDVCVAAADLTTPPAAGMTYLTTNNDGHTHDIVLTQAQLQTLGTGGSLTMESTNVDNHTHTFTLQKKA